MGFAVIMLAIIVLGLAVTGSRAGILLGMLGLLGSTFLAWGQDKNAVGRLGSRFVFLAVLGGLLLIGQFGMLGILRLAQTDIVSDYRTQIYTATIRAAWDYFPVGSGFGTFVPIYAMHETPATMIDQYINHAHNDWLELWLEGGLPAALIMIAFVVWYFGTAIRVWRVSRRSGALFFERAATIAVGLLLLHSFVEFPLRTPAMASLFGLFAGLIASAPLGARLHSSSSNPIATADPTPAFGRRRPYFAPRNARPLHDESPLKNDLEVSH
jgi:O-antigen ligase